MSGHSKWKTIKHKKATTDAKRGKVFTKAARLITVAAKTGGKDPSSNSDLRKAISEARNVNMPNDNIERAIKRGIGEIGGATLEEIMIEAYGPEGAAILIEIITDNRNRAISEVKHILSKHQGKIGGQGSVMWAFSRIDGEMKPRNMLDVSEEAQKRLLSLFEELDDNDDVQNIYTNVNF